MPTDQVRTILVVEDELLMATAMQHILESKGFHAIHVTTGEEAVALCTAGNEPVHLILMDIDLGSGIDGTEAAHRILAVSPIPIVFMSAHDEPAILARMETVPSYGYVAKNASEGVLIAAVRMAFTLHDATRQTIEGAQRFEALKNTAMDAFLAADMSGRLIDANELAVIMTGYDRSTLLSMTVSDLEANPDPAFLLSHMEQLQHEGQHRYEGTIRCASGVLVDVDVNVTLVKEQNIMLAFFTDCSQRNQTRGLIERERNRLASIIEGTDVGTWEWNVQTGETIFNERWAEIVGYTLAELQPVSLDTWSRLTHPEDLVRCEELLQRHFRGEARSYEIEIRMRHKAGHWVWILDRGRVREWTSDGKPLMMYGTHQDITARKRQDDADRDALLYNREIIRSIPAGVMTFKATGEVISANQAAADILGATVEVLEHQNFREVPTWKRTGLYDVAISVLETGETRTLEVRTRTGFGKDAWISALLGPLPHGPERELLFVMTDIAEQKRTEERIRTLLEEKDLLLKEVHHRVKNNMNTMRSILSLQASALPPGPAHDVLKDSEKRLISMMLLYEKLYKSSTMGMVQVDDYLKALLRDIVLNSAHGTRIGLTTEFDGFSLAARQMAPIGILVNELVTNAMKYAFAGRSEGVLRVGARCRDANVTITVSDDGVGLPAEVHASAGGGFGLQLVRLLTEQLGGVLDVASDEGTRWTVRFPME